MGIPENTVFHIGRPNIRKRPGRAAASQTAETGEPALTAERRVRSRVDGSVNQAVDARWQPKPPSAANAAVQPEQVTVSRAETAPDPAQADRPTHQAYRNQRSRLLKDLFLSLDRLTAPKKAPPRKQTKPVSRNKTPDADGESLPPKAEASDHL